MATERKRRRSTLPQPEARRHYVEIGELVVLEQIKTDSESLDEHAIAVGPFARLDASAVAAREGKTRGAVTNLFGSQAEFQAETMTLVLSASGWIEQVKFPAPSDFPGAEEWVDAFFAAQSARGPLHGRKPTVSYAYFWALWLSAVPYGLWSKRIANTSMDEYRQWLARLEEVLGEALDHFDMTTREGTTINDFACAVASLIEGVWLNQCLTTRHPSNPSEPIATVLLRSGRLLWFGATARRAVP